MTIDASLIKNRSKSFSCLGSIANNSGSAMTSSSSFMHDFSQHTKTRTCHEHSSSNIKRFHPSQLGKPPGMNQHSSRSVASASFSCSSELNKPPAPLTNTKIAPMKEVEKLIADLKKENFDLKLRLYHLEDIMSKDHDLYQLKQQNRKLQANLEDSSKHMEILQQELNMLLNKPTTMTSSIGIQTSLLYADGNRNGDDDACSVDSYFTALESPIVATRYQFNMDKKIESWLNHIDYTKSIESTRRLQI